MINKLVILQKLLYMYSFDCNKLAPMGSKTIGKINCVRNGCIWPNSFDREATKLYDRENLVEAHQVIHYLFLSKLWHCHQLSETL